MKVQRCGPTWDFPRPFDPLRSSNPEAGHQGWPGSHNRARHPALSLPTELVVLRPTDSTGRRYGTSKIRHGCAIEVWRACPSQSPRVSNLGSHADTPHEARRNRSARQQPVPPNLGALSDGCLCCNSHVGSNANRHDCRIIHLGLPLSPPCRILSGQVFVYLAADRIPWPLLHQRSC